MNVSTKPTVVYISHSAADDIEWLRDYLAGEGCVVRDSYDLSAPQDQADAIQFGISQADLVICATGAQTPNVFFELGAAVSLGKRTLLLIPPGATAPTFVADVPYVFSDLKNSDILRLALKRFLSSEPHASVRREISPERPIGTDTESIETILNSIAALRASVDPLHVERLAADLFRAAHVSALQEARAGTDRGVDFVIWNQPLQASVGNPILVQVKSGRLSGVKLRGAYNELLTQVLGVGAGIGLLLYLDSSGRRFDSREYRMPAVLAFDLEDFAREVSNKTFEKVVIERRNRLAHGLV